MTDTFTGLQVFEEGVRVPLPRFWLRGVRRSFAGDLRFTLIRLPLIAWRADFCIRRKCWHCGWALWKSSDNRWRFIWEPIP